jgi:CRISPR-associated endonuclease Csn1
LISPRFRRLNELTNSKFFGDYREINGHKVFINQVPEGTSKNFDLKRIDHRHHALDALIIALTAENHVNYLNNISSQNSDEDKLNTRRAIKFQLTNSKKGFNDEKEWYFLPPAQTKTRDGVEEYEYHYKEAKSKIFKGIAQNALENTVASFKQKKRVIRQRSNIYLKPEGEKISLVKQMDLEKTENYNVRKPLHLDTFYGKVKLQNRVATIELEQALKGNFDFVDPNLSKKISELKSVGEISMSELIELLRDEFPIVMVYEKYVASRFGNDLESLAQVGSDKILSTIESITDTGIQEILKKHLNNYILDVEGKDKYDTENAFSPDGVKELNSNIIQLNNGKNHQAIYKVRIADAMGTKFPVSKIGAKSSKYVVTAGGSNIFCGFYQRGDQRKFYIPTLRESVESLKQGYEPCPFSHPDEPDFKLLFVLNPSDLVYVPISEEQENPRLVNFDSLNMEQVQRIYKFRDGSINEKGGVQVNFIPSNWSNIIFKSSKEIGKIDLSVNKELKGEIALTSDKDKSQNTLDGNTQIRSVCWKLKVDRLGNLKSYTE